MLKVNPLNALFRNVRFLHCKIHALKTSALKYKFKSLLNSNESVDLLVICNDSKRNTIFSLLSHLPSKLYYQITMAKNTEGPDVLFVMQMHSCG